MNETLLAVLGVASGIFNVIGLIPYIRDILRHKTKPERATWWIWLTLNVIAFFAQLAAGATWSLFMTGAQLMAVLITAILSVKYGYGVFKKKDLLSLLIAMFGILLWKFTRDPLMALIIVIAVDALGFWLTLAKTWAAPHTETLIAWVFASISGTLGVLSVGELDLTKLIYPFYIMVGNWLLVLVIVTRRPHHR